MEKLTVKEALEQGYKYAAYNEQDFSICELIEKLTSEDFEHAETFHGGYQVCDKDAEHYSVSKDTIEGLIVDFIDCQEEFADEDAELSGIALADCDDLLQQLSDKMNDNLKSKHFYFHANINLVP